MADEFLAFLAAGLFLLMLGLLIVGITPAVAPAAVMNATAAFETQFDIAYASGKQSIDLGKKELFNGLFFGSNEIKHHIEKEGLEGLSVKFTVTDTNTLGPLEIVVNGKTAARASYALGDYTVNIGKEFLSNKTDIEIKASSSLWKIWAPNLYKLKNVKLETKSLAFEKKDVLFLLGSDLDNTEHARLELVLDKNIGRIKVGANGKEVFSGFVKNQQSLEIKKSDLKKGENKVELVPDKNSGFTGMARLVMFPKETVQEPQPSVRFRSLSMFEGDP